VFKGEEMVADSEWVDALKKRVMETPMNVSVELGRTLVPLGEVAHWEVGDVIQLPNRVTEPLELKVNQVPKFWGYPGERDGYVVFQAYGECEADDLNDEEDHG